MNPMTVKWLLIWLADEFHDWIDGDDAVEEYNVFNNLQSIYVKFDSGQQFVITVVEVADKP